MKKIKDILTIEYQFYLTQFEKTKDPKFAMQFADMVLNRTLKVQVVKDGELRYFASAPFKNKCYRCWSPSNKTLGYIQRGEPQFLLDGQNWHLGCATDSEKQNEWCAKHLGSLVAKTKPTVEPPAHEENFFSEFGK